MPAYVTDSHADGLKMRSILGLLLVLTCLSGCERSPLERLVYEHAKEQARLNAASFERNKQARERQQLALRRHFAPSDDDDDRD